MSAYYTPLQMRASSSAFQWGSIVHTTWKTGCLRKILIQSKGYESAIDSKYTILGKINEDRHEKRLQEKGLQYKKEVEFLRGGSVAGTTFSGHVDFLILDSNGKPWWVDELKSVSSKNQYRKLIKQGDYNVENLAQLVAYMVEARVVLGRLIYTFYDEEKIAQDERIYKVDIDAFGRIFVGDDPTQFTVNDLLAHQYAAAKVILESTVFPDRPFRGESPFVGCCNYCPFSTACAKYEAGELSDSSEFVQYVLKGESK